MPTLDVHDTCSGVRITGTASINPADPKPGVAAAFNDLADNLDEAGCGTKASAWRAAAASL